MTDVDVGNPVFPLAFLICAAPFVGSFLGAAAIRSCDGRSIVFGRSECDACHHPLGLADLIPLLSWLLLRRRCRYCGAALSTFYPAIELAAWVPVLWSALYMSGWLLVFSCILGWGLLLLAAIDGLCRRLPDVWTFGLMGAGFVFAALFDRNAWLSHILGAGIGYALFAATALAYRRLRRRDGLGSGDAKLLAALGAWLTWTALPTLVFLSAVLGLLYVFRNGFTHVERQTRIPFGPFLAVSGWIVWLYGPLVTAMP